jgi:hypothetical protein
MGWHTGRILQAQSGADGSYTFSLLESAPEGTLEVCAPLLETVLREHHTGTSVGVCEP